MAFSYVFFSARQAQMRSGAFGQNVYAGFYSSAVGPKKGRRYNFQSAKCQKPPQPLDIQGGSFESGHLVLVLVAMHMSE